MMYVCMYIYVIYIICIYVIMLYKIYMYLYTHQHIFFFLVQGSGHEFNGTVWHPTHGYVNSCDGDYLFLYICVLLL